MNPEILRAVDVAGQALAACRAALQWADATAATVSVREFLAAMAQREAFRARECSRWLVSLTDYYRRSGQHETAEQIRMMVVQVEGSAVSAEDAAAKIVTLARLARESEERRAAKRSAAELLNGTEVRHG